MSQQRTVHWEIKRRYRSDPSHNWSFWTVVEDAHLLHNENYFYVYDDEELPVGYYEYMVTSPKYEEDQVGTIRLTLIPEIYSTVGQALGQGYRVEVPTINLERIVIFPKQINFSQPNEQLQLKWTVYPVESTNKSVNWRTEDPDVAIVDTNGLITSVGSGRTLITGTTHEGVYDQCEVEVILVPQKLYLYPSILVLEKDNMALINITTYPNLQVFSDITINWKTDNYNKAAVISKGLKALVRAHDIGYAEITANIEGTNITETCQIVIKNHSIIRADNSGTVGQGVSPLLEVVNNG